MSGFTGTMLAAIAEMPGAPLRLTRATVPTPGQGEVLVRVMASGVNPLDLKILAGTAAHAQQPLPAILGIDMAGVVVAVGGGECRFREGDAVFGMAGGVGRHPGSLAEYMTVDARLLARKPTKLTMREAAAVPLVFITAWEGLVDRAALCAGETILVLGGAGGVGQAALQIAKALGARTVATGSPVARAAIERLGAVFEDKSVDPEALVTRHTSGQGFDIVFDTAGGRALDLAFNVVRRFGHVVSALGWGTHALAPLSFRAASYSGIFTLLPLLTGEGLEHHGALLAKAARLAENNAFAPVLDPRRFALADANAAYAALESGTARGKLVIEITTDPALLA